MKKAMFAALSALVLTGCDNIVVIPALERGSNVGTNAWNDFDSNPFRPDPNFEAKFVYRRDNWHHHYYRDKDGNLLVEYVEKCPDAK